EGNKATLAQRTITLDTGDTTFWDAFAQFCARAGLAEKPAVNSISRTTDVVILDGKPVQIINGNTLRLLDLSRAQQPSGMLTLVGAPDPARPTFLAGALRFRALPPSAAPQYIPNPYTSSSRVDPYRPLTSPTTKAKSDLVGFNLDVSPEPLLPLQNITR